MSKTEIKDNIGNGKTSVDFASSKDFKELARIDQIASEELQKWIPQSEESFSKTYKKSKYFIIAAKINGKMIGYLDASRDRKFDKNIYIENIFVLKEYRNKGVTKAMLQLFLNYWINRANAIALITADKNKEIFEKLGFIKTMNYMEFKK